MEKELTTNAKKVLLIEDDVFVGDILNQRFTQAGYAVSVLNETTNVLQPAADLQPDVILLDLMMPNKDGFEIMKELASDEKTRDIPIVVVSNLSEGEQIELAKKLGAAAYLTKANYLPEEVVEKVRGVIEQKEAAR